MKIRRFKIADGRHLVLPVGLLPAPGATNMRLSSDGIHTVDLDFDDWRVQMHQRFLANRIKLGDLIEVDASGPLPAPAATSVPAASSPAKPFEVNPPQGGK